MTASLAYMLGGGNSLVWSWFFWVHVHPIASVVWFVICFFALIISVEVHQFEQGESSTLTYTKSTQALRYAATDQRASDVIDIVVIPPPQLTNSKSIKNRKPQVAAVAIAQLPSSID